jgi:hypothetical protein
MMMTGCGPVVWQITDDDNDIYICWQDDRVIVVRFLAKTRSNLNSRNHPDRFWVPADKLFSGYSGLKGWVSKVTINMHLLSKSRHVESYLYTPPRPPIYLSNVVINTRWFKYDRDWFACKQVTVCPGHIWTTLYNTTKCTCIICIIHYILMLLFRLWVSPLFLCALFMFSKWFKCQCIQFSFICSHFNSMYCNPFMLLR